MAVLKQATGESVQAQFPEPKIQRNRLVHQIPYINQILDTCDDHNGTCSCGPTSAVIALAGSVLRPWPTRVGVGLGYEHVSDYGQYVSKRYTENGVDFKWTEPDPWGQLQQGAFGYCVSGLLTWWNLLHDYLALHGRPPQVAGAAAGPTWLRAQLEQNRVVIISTRILGYGHLVCCVGYDEAKFVVHDPWGDGSGGTYISGYRGRECEYTWQQLNPQQLWSVER